MTRVIVTLAPASMGLLPKRRTDMGSQVPRLTMPALRKVLSDRRTVNHTVKFRIRGFFGQSPSALRIGDFATLRQLLVDGCDEVWLIKPDHTDWCFLQLTRESIDNAEWTEHEWQVWLHNDHKEPWQVGIKYGKVPS